MSTCPLKASCHPDKAVDLTLLSRRQWVKRFVLGSAAALTGELTRDRLLADISPGTDPANIIRFPLANFPALLTDFGSVRLSLFNESLPGGVITVNRAADGVFYAMSPICTHAGCVVNPYSHASNVRSMVCECHGSVYDIQGRITTAVVQRQASLTAYATQVSGGELQVALPGVNLKVNAIAVHSKTGSTQRLALTFPTKSGARYRVRFSETLTSPPVVHPFFTTAAGTTSVTQLTQTSTTPNPRTVYVDSTTDRGFYFIELVVRAYSV